MLKPSSAAGSPIRSSQKKDIVNVPADLRLKATAVCILLSIGCQDSSEVSGVYALQDVDGVQVPRVVSSTVFCDELVLRGTLDLTGGRTLNLSVVQSQDCTRNGASVDTFTTTMTGSFSVDGAQILLQVAQPDTQLTGTSSSGVVEVQLPQLPLLGGSSHTAKFIRLPFSRSLQP